ncbi:glycerate kinase [Arthrobacter sp. ISL-65]|uniref:glycerate kinase n=1 Tax=Arthrobacter sp. ISL-65 TaxID=2819112 RepID=UPI001BE923B8|nr:glycerate kinase [Arthrobacter sp. ISL-65]MBT2549671.1 glycerate kinase [Arthrobacter sp. ISL-65]
MTVIPIEDRLRVSGAGLSVLIAPDKFKGSLTASQVARAIAHGLRKEQPGLNVIELPVADGGDGTLDAFLASGYVAHPISVTGPDNDLQPSTLALKDGTAVIETALTSGLAMRGDRPLSPLSGTSRGVGDAILAALGAGARRIIIGLGGSACTDGGAGMLQALGVSLRDGSGAVLYPGGVSLLDLHTVDISGLDPRIWDTEIILATDVTNPLCGPDGAAAVYGPQKGASSEHVTVLDRALGHFASLVAPEAAHLPGAGAAGGIGYAALAVLGATARPGIELIMELLDFESHLAGADLVITGEGRLDDQSFHGKAPMGVLMAAARHNIPTIAVCGSSQLTPAPRHPDFDTIHAITDIAPDIATAIRNAEPLLERLAAQITVRKRSARSAN